MEFKAWVIFLFNEDFLFFFVFVFIKNNVFCVRFVCPALEAGMARKLCQVFKISFVYFYRVIVSEPFISLK